MIDTIRTFITSLRTDWHKEYESLTNKYHTLDNKYHTLLDQYNDMTTDFSNQLTINSQLHEKIAQLTKSEPQPVVYKPVYKPSKKKNK